MFSGASKASLDTLLLVKQEEPSEFSIPKHFTGSTSLGRGGRNLDAVFHRGEYPTSQ